MFHRNIVYVGIILLSIGLLLNSCNKEEQSTQTAEIKEVGKEEIKIQYWTCGMHPSVKVSPEEYEKGNIKCPICNMDLVPVYEEEEAPEVEGEVVLKLSPRAQKLASVRTSEVMYLPLTKEIYTVGRIDYDEKRLAYVASWVQGRIDKLFVDFTGIEVKKGEPLVWIYSPSLISTQNEYLLALETLEKVKGSHIPETIEGARSLIESTKRRLLLWGITERQIEELEKTKNVRTHMTIYTPISGTVIHKMAVEGKYVKEGENIYHIADLTNIWMLADIFEYELSWVKVGQKVEIITPTYPGESFKGTVSFIDPFLNEKTRSCKVRVDVPNPKLKLKPGMYVDATLKIPIGPKDGLVLAVPKSSVLDVGLRKLVYIDIGEGKYLAKEVKIGPEASTIVKGRKERFYPILEGLAEGDKVVTRANFLIDSQTQLTGEAAGAYGGALEVEE